ncbi:MAG: hypothetical protein M1438_09290 [Deltaproteobacteria bacterium]|nr:hypothetical protein [Deltaproteobacteria bacterium]
MVKTTSKADFPRQRLILVKCLYCGARLGQIKGDFLKVVGICRTCTYHLTAGAQSHAA